MGAVSMKAISFAVPGKPHGKGRPRASSAGGRVRMYTDKTTAAYEDRVAWMAAQAMTDRHPIEGPVAVQLTTYRQRPKRPAAKHECRAGLRLPGESHVVCTSKPDADNAAKSVLDGCNLAGVWRDDVQVVSLTVLKRWCNEGEQPRTVVHVLELQAVTP